MSSPSVGPSEPRPLIGVPADTRNTPSRLRSYAVDANTVEAVALASNALPVAIPPIADLIDLDALLQRLDGIVLPGAASNVHPARYGVDPTDEHAPFDQARDALTMRLIRHAIVADMPMLCICRGYQELNVALGGTLVTEVQRIPGRLDHRFRQSPDVDEWFAPAHRVALTPGGFLERLLGKPEVLVNSLHRQAVDRLGDGLVVEAKAPDGIIEAVSLPSATFVLGTQWHAEYRATDDADSLKLFQAFGDAARRYAARSQ